jgi:hypothetical protein
MASRKSPSAPAWQVILERIESQNRMTIEAVEASRAVMDDRFRALESHLGGRSGNLETAMSSGSASSRSAPRSTSSARRSRRTQPTSATWRPAWERSRGSRSASPRSRSGPPERLDVVPMTRRRPA